MAPTSSCTSPWSFSGPGLRHLDVNDRLTISNMLVEAGVKTALFPHDDVLESWLKSTRGEAYQAKTRYSPGRGWESDAYKVELGELEPMIASLPNPLNVKTVREVEGVEVDQVFIGNYTNGRLKDIAIATRILKGRKARARLIVAPASRRVLLEALRREYIDILVEAGAIIAPPGCDLCFGAHIGLLSDGEVLVSIANRNFPGKNGPISQSLHR